MKIYKLSFSSENYEWLQPLTPLTYDDLHSFDGRSHIKDWKPIKVKKMKADKGEPKNLPLGDAPNISFAPAFSIKAKDALYNLIKNEVEFLDLNCNEGDFCVINITNVLDVIDRDKSIYKTFSDGIRIMRFIKYSFINSSKLRDSHIFKIQEHKYGNSSFVSEKFKKCVEDNKLEGFVFEEVWDSEKD